MNEYLLKNEYKLSSITFSDENDDQVNLSLDLWPFTESSFDPLIYFYLLFPQDFELWDDVGLNIPKPPDLLQLYRNCGTPLLSPRDTADASVGVDPGDLPGNCDAQDSPRNHDASRQDDAKVSILLVWHQFMDLVSGVMRLQTTALGYWSRIGCTPTRV